MAMCTSISTGTPCRLARRAERSALSTFSFAQSPGIVPCGGFQCGTSLVADGQLPGRFLASEGDAGIGVVVYEIPGSKPGGPAKKRCTASHF